MFNLLMRGLLAVLLGCLLLGCHKQSGTQTTNYTVITVQPKVTVTALHFSGTLGPLDAQSVLSPLDGRVSEVLFSYGQPIEKGQALITLDSAKLSEDYRKTVSEFLEKKQAYEISLASFQGTEALYKAGVISKEEYSTAASHQRSDTLAFYQSKYELEKLLVQTSLPVAAIEQLNLADMKKVNEILNRQFKNIKIFAPSSGVALFPTPEQKKEAATSGRITVGDEIKAGQLILSIGDLSGFSMKINVSEISINLIKPNLPAKITGDAFPGILLSGYVSAVAAQANPQEGGEGGLGMFEVRIKIPNVTDAQRRIIHVGMSAQAELDIPEPPQIYLPIKAVYQKNGQRMVTILNKSGQRQEVPVVTGKTTLTEVAIIQGISPGDRVVVPH